MQSSRHPQPRYEIYQTITQDAVLVLVDTIATPCDGVPTLFVPQEIYDATLRAIALHEDKTGHKPSTIAVYDANQTLCNLKTDDIDSARSG